MENSSHYSVANLPVNESMKNWRYVQLKFMGILFYETLLSRSDNALALPDVQHPGAGSALHGPVRSYLWLPHTTLQLTDSVEVRREKSIPKLFIVIVIYHFISSAPGSNSV